MLARAFSFAIDGVQTRRVAVEADVRLGLPAFNIVGLADKSVREARERVRAAIVNTGFEFPAKRITVNLAPAYLRKEGPHFDLPLAIAVLAASGQVDLAALEGCAFIGELSMYGSVSPVRGALAVAEGARRSGLTRLMLPATRAAEAALVEGVCVLGIESLPHGVAVLRGEAPAVQAQPEPAGPPDGDPLDLADVRGHTGLMPAIEVAAAGGHNLFMHGPPGTGKTMIARRLPTLLPPLTREEAVEVTRIHSIAGLHDGRGLITERPFRAPHHLISPSGLVGGGATPTPGEITLAHRGVLFLDELSEFNRNALESLRQPLEDGRVVVVRAQRVLTFPTAAMLVAAANPCPCGQEGARCRCSAAERARHDRRLSGPLLDRMDITVHVGRPSAARLRDEGAPASAAVREHVVAARERQTLRLRGTAATCNAQLTPLMLRELARITPSARRRLFELHDASALTARGHHRVLRVARTVADLAGSAEVGPEHISAALALRADSADTLAA
jgi:magnesium chelatase family protein